MTMNVCAVCAAPLPDTPQRARLYCSARCSARAWRMRHGPRPDGRKWDRKDNRKRVRPGRAFRQRRPILGIDSETVNDATGAASLVLVACSDGTHIAGNARQPITTEAALSYIVGRQGELWTFFGDYDVNFWIRDFSPKALDRLRRTNWTYCGDWRIHHIPRRIFEVWHRPTKRYACVYDAFPFVQSSFVNWLHSWQLCNLEVLRSLREMKERRSTFAEQSPASILRYTRNEVAYIASGVERLKERVTGAGYVPARWLGPGAIAAKALRVHNAKNFMPRKQHPHAEEAYYGGRIETAGTGLVRAPLWYYDLNSAYPSAIARLPCLAHGKWRRTREAPPPGAVALVRVSWAPKKAGSRPTWGPFPCRPVPGGSLRYYAHGVGWYWWKEVEPWLVPESPYRITVQRGTVWEPSCDHTAPLDWIAELYDKRRAMKQAGDPAEYALKLILNSCYGKFAQRVGRAPFRSVEWAGLVTATTRARLAPLLVAHPEAVLLTATDGVVTRTPFGVGVPGRLGEWDLAGRYTWADVWQPGFYVLSDGKVRTRGFTRADVDIEAFRRAWLERGALGSVEVSRDRVIGYRLATARGSLVDYCQWKKDKAEVHFWPLPRRDPVSYYDRWAPTVAPYSWAAEGKGRKRELEAGAAWAKERESIDYLNDGEPQGYLRD